MTESLQSAPQNRVLLLDVDGVLVTPPEMFGARLLRSHPEVATEFFCGPFMTASRGEADLLDVLPPYLERLGYTGTVNNFVTEWFESENHPNHLLPSERLPIVPAHLDKHCPVP
ncbi:hypothetical protein FNU79_00670 [Deinococcus detaillensis]|uniref:HAD family hydrolase n=1 Tax=Deinococcus detaillensis TaxID=2592048 RepID=A0A553V5Q7_9DEIO|nr:hypothetical protein [Deinococcus detaillensis]TSA87803.1 hypothetical protein FNU79_00670 [Deinococcus detaillensis]